MIKNILLLLLLSPLCVKAQDFYPVNYDSIETVLKENKTVYKETLNRFLKEETLSTEELRLIYYGAVFQENYDPYGEHKKEKEFFNYYNELNYKEALAIGEEILKDEPLDIEMIFSVFVCANELKDQKKIDTYMYYYLELLTAIRSSGDGLTATTAFVVTRISDEYAFMGQLGVEHNKQALVGTCDKFTLTEKGEEFTGDEIYFDVSKPLESLWGLDGK